MTRRCKGLSLKNVKGHYCRVSEIYARRLQPKMEYISRFYVLAVFVIIICPDASYGQTTSFNSFAEVSVADHSPVFDQDAKKVYTTSIKLKQNPGVNFQATAFDNAATDFYNSAFVRGFFDVNNVRQTELTNDEIQVTYDVVYLYVLLLDVTPDGDTTITNTIGTFETVKRGLDSQGNILGFNPVVNDPTSFSFSGNQMCLEATCNGTYVSCVETTNGIRTTCVSQCKDNYCYNDALCIHSDANIAPQCRCPTYPDLWVIGERCETKFALWLAILLAVIGFLIILVVIFVVVVCVRKRQRRKAKKQALLNTVPRSHVNPAFQSDIIRTQTNGTNSSRATQNVNTTAVAREDSFLTVTSSERPNSEDRPRSNDSRSRHRNSSTYHHRDTDRGRRSRDDRERIRSSSSDASRAKPGKRDSSNEKQEVASTSSSSEYSTNPEDPNNISFFEVDVNDLDLQSENGSSVAVSNGAKPSPIRWLPPKSNEPRAGWVPSLGPMMYELPTGNTTTPTAHNDVERIRTHGTEV